MALVDHHLAALALQDDATVVSYDNDFSRFPGVRWQRPSAPAN
jgi:predicted nucleic acid-binding protein